MFVNVSIQYNPNQAMFQIINGVNATCFNIVMLNGFRNVFFNNTINSSAAVPSLGVSNNLGANMICLQSPFLTTAGITYVVAQSNPFDDAVTNQVSIALNGTNFGSNTSATSATWFEFYTDSFNVTRMNPITQFNLMNCGVPSGQQSSNDAVTNTKSTAAYVLSLVIAIASAVLMIAL
jgi:hypothetical protein